MSTSTSVLLQSQVTWALMTNLELCCQHHSILGCSTWHIIKCTQDCPWHLCELLGLGKDAFDFVMSTIGWKVMGVTEDGPMLAVKQSLVEAFIKSNMIKEFNEHLVEVSVTCFAFGGRKK